MYELSACIETLFTERPFTDRIHAAAAAGLPAVEFWHHHNKDLPGLRAALADTGLTVSSFVADPPGRLVDPTTHPMFLEELPNSCRLAVELGCPNLVVLAGDTLPGVEPARQQEAVVTALRAAAPLAADHGITLVLEPLNTRIDHPGHFLAHTPTALDILTQVDHPNVQLLYDLYHSVVMGEQPEEVLAGNLQRVGHVQIADVPGRHEPGSGTIDWTAQLGVLTKLGYQGRIGLEYWPTGPTQNSLAHIQTVVHSAG